MDNNRRIALNTGIIYIKLILNALIGLYTSRLVLSALGENDYGLYNVVGGIVVFLNVIGTTMVSVSYRFIAVEMGRGDGGSVRKVFNTVYVIHIFLAIGLLLIGETVGLYYVNHFLNVIPGKLPDARFVLHASLLTTAISVMSVPVNGLIIAREKFMFTSIVEIVSILIKLGLVVFLTVSLGNRLRIYAIIMFIVTALVRIAYQAYCALTEKEIIRWEFNRDWQDYKKVFGFAWWSLFGALAYTGKEQGASMIINLFFGTSLNAAFGLASQVNRYSMMFTKGLSQAAVPQIMKSYGAGNTSRSLALVYVISRYSTLILLIIAIPLLLCIDDVLTIWLKTPPEYTGVFTTFLLINALVSILGAGFDSCIQSTGSIKINEMWSSIIYLSLLPIIFFLYKLGAPPYINVVVLPILTLIVRIMQLFIMRQIINFSISDYLKQTFFPCIITAFVSFLPLCIIRRIVGHSMVSTFIFLASSVLWVFMTAFFLGVSKSERQKLIGYINTINK